MPTQIKTILFLPAWYPTRNDNLGGMFVRAFGLALLEKTNVHVLHIAGDKRLKTLFEFTRHDDEGINTFILYYRKFSNKNGFTVLVEGFLYGLGTLLAYYKYRKHNQRPDVFHGFVLTRAAVLPYLLSFFSNTNYYITEVWSRYLPEDDTFNGAFRKWLARRIVKRSNGISTVSQSLKNALIAHGLNNSNFPIIHSVVPKPFFETEIISHSENAVLKFLHVSCFDDYIKNISGMLNAFKIVQEQNLPFKLQLVGTGADFDAMVSHAENLGLKNVIFSGKLVGANLFEAFASADVLVLFSNFETQGCVILEAQACGMPVIGAATGGIPELIGEGKGLLVEPGDDIALAESIKNMIKNYCDYDNFKIRNQAIANYSFEHIVDKFINFYEKGLKK